ncbi:ribonuclease Oy-like isoform X1 [Rhagoletis pomonella]|uniref:ribonuclease Oy-like isoform X1 n=1 Tax=Rhagoletis pomonella TaxID=28610 RepID=UPI00177BCE97|nr:ribonuclease Oy-like isoform X1 [Rhagoletis pomonella]
MGQKLTLWATFGIVLLTTQWLDVISSTIGKSSEESFGDNGDISSTDLYNDGDLISNELSPFNEISSDESSNTENDGGNLDWDVLIFTQQWPVTTCYHWREEDSTHACSLPDKKEFWTIHGVWPTKLGHMGPSFCNKTADFDLNQLEQILTNLKTYWPTIDGQQKLGYFWRHEWLKHGTCAVTLEELDNELKYFKQGLAWREQFLMSNILGNAGIHPDSNNTVVALQTALLKTLGKNPSIHCIYDNKRDMSYLEEIRICFNKQLELTDCDGVLPGDAVSINYPGGTVITNCHISKPIHYPSNMPPLLRMRKADWKFPVVNTYKLLQFIMWFTL